jgi:ATP-binding cassette subfamily B protein AbcA/BmrA
MNTFKVIKNILPFFRPFYKPLAFSFTLVFLVTLFELSDTFIIGRIVDSFVSDTDRVGLWLGIFFLTYIIQTVLQRIQAVYEIRNFDFEMGHYISSLSLEKTLGLSLGQIKKEHSGFKQSVLNKGRNSINNIIFMSIYEILPLFSQIVLSFIGLVLLKQDMLPVLVGYLVLYIFSNIYINRKMYGPIKDLTEEYSSIDKSYSDVLRNLFFVKFSGQTKRTTDFIKKLQASHIFNGRKVWTKYQFDTFFLSDVMSVLFLGIVISTVYQDISAGLLSIGNFVPLISWVFSFMYGLARLRRLQRRFVLSLADAEKMFDMLQQKSDIIIDSRAREIKKIEDKISFEEVSFDYKDGKKGALHQINFEIKKGEKVALVGRSGSGKTTIVSLLLRLYDPKSGSIFVDGVDLKSLVLENWHNLIAYVPQDSDLLDISIRENIVFGTKKKITQREIEEVLEKAGIKEFIHNLPKGIDTIVGERGVKLSGGQKQRVCIARALIKNAPILLLDEATSSLDSETEHVVNKAIWDMLGDKTGIVIAHRLSTILDADKIIVMDGGEVLGIGTHAELLKSSPYYKKLVDAQNVNL